MSQDERHEQARIIIATVKLLRNRFFSERYRSGTEERLDRSQITDPQIGMMTALRDEGEISLKHLAEALGVSSPSASAMVERLYEAGIVDRRPSTEDRREVRINLTAEGEAIVDAYEQAWLYAAADVLEKVGPDCADQWCAVFRRVQDVLKAERNGGAMQQASLKGERAS